ncbi:TetR/AcrR family transcriptional regulator [uncultured Clostridium sp.]|uniref:TetR/AcrR family transcriptional regulator n=1 Tax=uncultured Clostridium sp. TaxID=59620 RepID=UPI0025E02359|nr:TetR/AcrR family transcriptional regulator [uncultured Clostridium sp.]
MTTKEIIVYESLKLFSTNGFDAVSTRMIARAVKASDAVIYKHFKSKQEILDSIIEKCTSRYMEKRNSVKIETICWKDVEEICMDMFHFQTTDEWITMFRKLLMIEQFKNPKMAALYREIFIDSSINSMAKMFETLIEMGYMKKGTPEVYAMELYAPFFMYHTIGGESEKIVNYLEEHVRKFREDVVTDICYLDRK